MKIRRGFVSNSSSSSFIIPTDSNNLNLGNVYSIAKYMIPSRDWGKDDIKTLQKLEEAIEKGIITKDTNLFFHSCNFDTFIMKKGYNFYIDTCNNHDYNISNEYYTESKYYTEALDIGALMEDVRFYYIEEGIFVTVIPYESCYSNPTTSTKSSSSSHSKKKECYGEIFKADDGNKYCIKCQTDKFKVEQKKEFSEKEKKFIKIMSLKIEILSEALNITYDEILQELKKK